MGDIFWIDIAGDNNDRVCMQDKINSDKLHWDRLKQELAKKCNGKVILYFQDALPIKIEEIEGKERDIDLTKLNDKLPLD